MKKMTLKFFLAWLALTAWTVFANISYFSDWEQLTASRMNEIVDSINTNSWMLNTISTTVSSLNDTLTDFTSSLVFNQDKVIISSSTWSLISSNP